MRSLTPRWRAVLRVGALFLGLVVLIGAVNWPWPLYFRTGFVRHFDPPLHAWKLNLVAHSLLQGHWLPENGNSNCFYPNSLTLFYEALHWPQSVLAAGFLLFTDNPILVYNLVHLFFWAFSGCCLFWLLKEWGCSNRAAAWASAVFCIMPYRVSYLVEFNMQQCFGLILSLLFMVRFLRRPSIFDACGFAVAFWLQAVSELYQALILATVLPFLALPWVVHQGRALFRNPRFYLGGAAAALLGGVLARIFLWPYAILHGGEGYAREMSEIAKHTLEPLSYFLRAKGGTLVPHLSARHDEMSVYPTLGVLIGAAIYGMGRWVRRRTENGEGGWPSFFRLLRSTGVAVFFLTVFAIAFYPRIGGVTMAAVLLNLSIMAALLGGVGVSCTSRETDVRSLVMSGLATAAWLSFVLSFGPEITVWASSWACSNPLFLLVFRTESYLNGMRVVSRFSVIVLLFLVAAAAMGWESLLQRRPRLQWLWIPLLALVMLESRGGRPRFVTMDYPLASSLLERADARGPYTLLVLPFGERRNDSTYMFSIAHHDRFLLYGWGGFYPPYHSTLDAAYRAGDVARVLEWLGKVWPEPLLLVDRNPAYPRHENLRQTDNAIMRQCRRLDGDDRFDLYQLPHPTSLRGSTERLIRRDVLDAHPIVRFRASVPDGAPGPVTLGIAVNGTLMTSVVLNPVPRDIEFRVPEAFRVDVHPNSIGLLVKGNAEWRLEDFAFIAQAASPPPSSSVPPAETSEDFSGELGHVDALPPSATAVDVRFENGIKLVGYRIDDVTVSARHGLNMQLYWKIPQDVSAVRHLTCFVHFMASPRDIDFQDDHPLLVTTTESNIRSQPTAKIFVEQRPIEVPDRCRSGRYHVEIGLLDVSRDRRLKGTASLTHRDNAFVLPLVLDIRGADADAKVDLIGADAGQGDPHHVRSEM